MEIVYSHQSSCCDKFHGHLKKFNIRGSGLVSIGLNDGIQQGLEYQRLSNLTVRNSNGHMSTEWVTLIFLSEAP